MNASDTNIGPEDNLITIEQAVRWVAYRLRPMRPEVEAALDYPSVLESYPTNRWWREGVEWHIRDEIRPAFNSLKLSLINDNVDIIEVPFQHTTLLSGLPHEPTGTFSKIDPKVFNGDGQSR